MIQDIRPIVYTMTIDNKTMKLRFDMNALDYLERACGDYARAFSDESIQGQKQILRAALLCNYPDNGKLLDEGRLSELEPSLSQVGAWFDVATMQAVAAELYRIALEQTAIEEGEHRPGEQKAALEAAVTAIGCLSKLYGRSSLEEALRISGYLPHGKSSGR